MPRINNGPPVNGNIPIHDAHAEIQANINHNNIEPHDPIDPINNQFGVNNEENLLNQQLNLNIEVFVNEIPHNNQQIPPQNQLYELNNIIEHIQPDNELIEAAQANVIQDNEAAQANAVQDNNPNVCSDH